MKWRIAVFWMGPPSLEQRTPRTQTGWKVVLLGGTFLREYVVELDFATRRVRFLNPERYRVPEKVDAENEGVIPIQGVCNRPLVEVSIGGSAVQGCSTRVAASPG